MRKLIKMFDLDDARWFVVLVLAAMCSYSLDTAWQVQAAQAKQQDGAWRIESAMTGMHERIEKLEAQPPVQAPLDLPRVNVTLDDCTNRGMLTTCEVKPWRYCTLAVEPAVGQVLTFDGTEAVWITP